MSESSMVVTKPWREGVEGGGGGEGEGRGKGE